MGEIVCPKPSTFGHRPSEGSSSLVFWIERIRFHTASAFVARTVRALRHRREVWRLAEYDERALHDIGLVRSDVLGALSEPLHCDPSITLAERVEKRIRRPMRRA
jgi:uncharacterized protein YjiS (DUF1127 family)